MSVSMGLQAALLIRLDARAGEWVSVEDLATHHCITPAVAREGLQALWDQGYVSCRLSDDGLIDTAMTAGKG